MPAHRLAQLNVAHLVAPLDSPELDDFYVYRSAHTPVMARRSEWFHRMRQAWHVLRWVPAGHRPTLEEAHARLEALRADGPSAAAFERPWPMPDPSDAEGTAAPAPFDDRCPAS